MSQQPRSLSEEEAGRAREPRKLERSADAGRTRGADAARYQVSLDGEVIEVDAESYYRVVAWREEP